MNYTNFDQLPLVLTVEEVASILRLGKASTYNLLHSGQLKSAKSGNKYIVPKAAVIDYLSTD